MRPLRFMLLLAFFVALPIFLTCWSLFGSHDDPAESYQNGYGSRPGRLRALFSFSTPSSLFPPSAVISLTNDNSTFFLARPAAFGPSLPSRGLSGQLWVGKGFGDDPILKEGRVQVMGWELGCSDVPGWAADEQNRVEKIAKSENAQRKRRSEVVASGIDKLSSEEITDDTSTDEVQRDDGTDDYLHHPLPDSNPATPGKPGEPANVNPADKNKRPTHADIESLQESADIAGKIVMLARGGCGFLEKVKWAQRRGGIGVIVGDNERGGQLTIMYAKGDTSNVTIPALFTSYTSAHLLSSLVPPDSPDDDEATSKVGSRISKEGTRLVQPPNGDKPTFTSTTAISRQPTAAPAHDSHRGDGQETSGWVKHALAALGLNDNSPFSHLEDSRRPPSSGNIDWVLLEDWEDDAPSNVGTGQGRSNPKLNTASTSTPKSTSVNSQKPAGDDFVIGVQDWRDTDLVAPKSAYDDDINPGKSKNGKASEAGPSSAGKAEPSVETTLKGGSITPGSGEYEHQKVEAKGRPSDNNDQSRSHRAQHDDARQIDESRRNWLSALRSDTVSDADRSQNGQRPNLQQDDSPRNGKGPKDGGQEQEGLWVTLTPTSVSTSPFFDTLLVLVVSPLVTLTVVYALLLLRSRIRRRRWRAPKSVVERLPVRTYHTMSTTSSTTSSQISSPDQSSASSPLLCPIPQDISRRSRPRSQTTIGVFGGTSTDGQLSQSRSPPPEKPASKTVKRKRYTGRQVECVVCLEEYIDGESQIMSLPCGHEFHAECITPWLVNRRRTCPICKGDVVRSLARANQGARGADQREDDEQTSDDVQTRVVQTVNDEPSAAIPIPSRIDDGSDDEDIERGQDIDEPPSTSPRRQQPQSSWRNIIGASMSRLSGDTVWRQTPVDRTR